MPFPPVRAVLLDAGHTLLRPRPSMGEVYAAVCRRHGRPADPAALEAVAVGAFHRLGEEIRGGGPAALVTSEAIERETWRRHALRVVDGVPALAGLDFDPWFEDLYDTFGGADTWEPYPDAVPALAGLRARGLRLALVSNWDTRVRRILEETGLTPWFDAIVISSEVGVRKPDPRIFHRALELVGVAPGEAIHAGDSRGDDLEGARAAGVRGVFVARDGAVPPPGAVFVRDLKDLVRLVS